MIDAEASPRRASSATAPRKQTALVAAPIALAKAGHEYTAAAQVSAEGLGHHLERTVWREVDWSSVGAERAARVLQRAAKVAASQYVERLDAMTFGVLGPVRSARSPNTVYFSPFGLKILKIMGFGEFEESPDSPECGVSCSVSDGFLMARHAPEASRGRLDFRWRWDASRRCEVFETEVRDYTPRIAGRRSSKFGRWFYRLTQANFHKIVMWGYHWWVRRHRESLLIEATQQIENHRLR